MTPSDNARRASITAVELLVRATQNRDFERVSALLADDAVLELPFAPEWLGRGCRGREEIVSLMRSATQLMVDQRVGRLSLDTRHGDPEQVVGTYDFQATLADGTVYRSPYVVFCTVTDGLITGIAEHFDSHALAEAMANQVRTQERKVRS